MSVADRRRSVDIGGLRLATENQGHGNGWVGNGHDLETKFAELIVQLKVELESAVTHAIVPSTPPPSVAERARLIHLLDTWCFEPYNLTRDEIMNCTVLLFEALLRTEGLQEELGISLEQVNRTVHHLREIYREENAYHNYEHALDVLQASQSYLRAAGMVPPITILLKSSEVTWRPNRKPHQDGDLMSTLTSVDIFALYIAAIGHDVGHPGFTNAFMKNAQSPLSLMFDNKSALEEMHFTLLTRIMRHNGLSNLLDSRPCFRTLLRQAIMATDMRVHDNFMTNFKTALCNLSHTSRDARRKVLAEGIIKCADISNPTRPHRVSKYWATALVKEWTNQRHYEARLDLPPSLAPSNTPLAEAQSQLFFMKTFATPLLQLFVDAVPECRPFLDECSHNFDWWCKRSEELQKEPPPETTVRPEESSEDEHSDDYHSAFTLALPGQMSPKPESSTWSSDSPTMSEMSTPCSPIESEASSFTGSYQDLLPRDRRQSNSSSYTNGSAITGLPAPPATAPHYPFPGHLTFTNDITDMRAAAMRAGGKRPNEFRNRSSWSPDTASALLKARGLIHIGEKSSLSVYTHGRSDSNASSTLSDAVEIRTVLSESVK
ncbi:hypothetical protein DL96DRAFT_1597541, partial [Flagelloscypha sp. PMI_526]